MENEKIINRRRAITSGIRTIAGVSIVSIGFYEYDSVAKKIEDELSKEYPQVEEVFSSQGLGGSFKPRIKNEYKSLTEEKKKEIILRYKEEKFKMQRTPIATLQIVIEVLCAVTGIGSIISGIKEAREIETRNENIQEYVLK